MGDEVRVTVIAAGFDRWEEGAKPAPAKRSSSGGRLGRRDEDEIGLADVFAPTGDDLLDDEDDDFDVPSFLK
jgi:cell division protein FtsZ